MFFATIGYILWLGKNLMIGGRVRNSFSWIVPELFQSVKFRVSEQIRCVGSFCPVNRMIFKTRCPHFNLAMRLRFVTDSFAANSTSKSIIVFGARIIFENEGI